MHGGTRETTPRNLIFFVSLFKSNHRTLGALRTVLGTVLRTLFLIRSSQRRQLLAIRSKRWYRAIVSNSLMLPRKQRNRRYRYKNTSRRCVIRCHLQDLVRPPPQRVEPGCRNPRPRGTKDRSQVDYCPVGKRDAPISRNNLPLGRPRRICSSTWQSRLLVVKRRMLDCVKLLRADDAKEEKLPAVFPLEKHK